jgi:hypothetical protein
MQRTSLYFACALYRYSPDCHGFDAKIPFLACWATGNQLKRRQDAVESVQLQRRRLKRELECVETHLCPVVPVSEVAEPYASLDHNVFGVARPQDTNQNLRPAENSAVWRGRKFRIPHRRASLPKQSLSSLRESGANVRFPPIADLQRGYHALHSALAARPDADRARGLGVLATAAVSGVNA